MNSYAGQIDGQPGTVTVGPQALDLDGRVLPYVDMDTVAVDGYRITIGMHPAGGAVVSALGPRTDAFVTDLDAQRSAARRAALLQWTGTAQLAEFTQAPGGPADVPTHIHVFDDGLTVEPRNGVPELVPYGLVERVDRDGYAITFQRKGSEAVTVRRLGPRTDEFIALVGRGRTAQRQAVAAAYGSLDDRLLGYSAPNGWAMSVTEAGTFGGALADAFAAGDRAQEMTVLAGLAGTGMRYGLALQPEGPMPFALATAGSVTAVESADSDAARATYLFRTTDADALNRALIMISFRREALYLPADNLGRWSLAVRTLPVVQWARSVLVTRVIHDDNWEGAVTAALR